MYAVYNYAAGATQANVLADVVAILTGTTNVASLSASCVQANTSISTALRVAGWTLYDAAAGATFQMLTANDQSAVAKFWGINFSTTTAFSCAIAETWNATTHTGTNTCSSNNNSWDAVNGGFLYIYASQKEIVILSWTTAGGFRGVTGLTLEFSRLTIPAGYPCYHICTTAAGSIPTMGITGGSNSWLIPRVKNLSSAGNSTVQQCNCGPMASAGGPTASYGLGLYRDASETQFIQLYQFGLNFNGVVLGVNYDVRYSQVGTVNPLDQLSYSGSTYVAFGTGTGLSPIWVPKG